MLDPVRPNQPPAPEPESPSSLATLTVRDAGDHRSHVVLRGSLSIEETQAIEPAFTAAVTARRRATVVELAEVTFLASYALSMLVSASRALRLRKHPFILVAPNPDVDSLLRSTRLHQIMSIAPTLDEAFALIAEAESGEPSVG